MIKRLIIMLLAVGIVLGLIFGFGMFRSIMIGKFLATLSNPSQTVATVEAKETPWQPSLHAVASLVAINGANLSAEVDGIVDTIDFESGEDVPAGKLLLTLRANNDPQVLAQLQATAALDALNYKRDVKQLAADGVSQATVDTDRATLASANAQVQAQQMLIAEKQIHAPFAGRLGIRQVDLGQYLSAGTQIVTLQQLDPLFVDFYVPQQALGQISVGQALTVNIDAFPGRTFPGKITAINSAIDTTTRMVQVRAGFSNPGLVLRPGMFATVDIGVGQPQNLVTLPQAAIGYNPYGDTVFIVTPDNKAPDNKTASATNDNGKTTNGGGLVANQQFVTTGATRGDQVAILQGVKAGDQVVSAGQLKLKNGSPVTINNSIQPTNDINPAPPNE